MSSPDPTAGQQKYYDPAEVEAYVADVTATIKTLQARLQEAVRRAEHAEQSGPGERWDQASGDYHPESASLGRALLLAGEVADKTIADADTRAAEIARAAEYRAAAIVEAAHTEARRLVDTASGAAAEVFQKGEARLLAAVSAFVEGSNVLRAALSRIEDDATSWRNSGRTRPTSDRPASDLPPLDPAPAEPLVMTPPPALHQATEQQPDYSPPPGPAGPPDQPGGVHNRATRNGHRPVPDVAAVDRSVRDAPPTGPPYLTLPPPAAGSPT